MKPKWFFVFLVCVWVNLVAMSCEPPPRPSNAPAGEPRAWIDAPLDGSTFAFPLATPLEIVSHASDPARIVQVELNVNGAVVRADPNPEPGKRLVTMRQTWSPPAPGNYTVLVRAQNSLGTWSGYARAIITIGGIAPGAQVQGTVYSDVNGNGLPNDPGDAPLDGVVVMLSGCAAKTTTTVNGTFQFAGLPAGKCLVQVSKAGWKFSGTFPAGLGHPAQVVADPAKPFALSLFMTPLATLTPTPTRVPGAPPALPSVSIAFFADQLTVPAGQCTVLHWQVTNAAQIALDNAAVAASDSRRVCPAQTTTHTLRVVTLDNQTVQRTVTLNVMPITPTPTPTRTPTRTPTPPPIAPRGCVGSPSIASFGASPASIYVGQSATLSWGAVTNADAVEIDQGIGGVATPGNVSVSPHQTTIYTLTARCGANSATRQTTVTVLTRGIIVPPIATSTPTPIRPIIK